MSSATTPYPSKTVIPTPRKAEKKRVKLKMAVQGPSGSGKTWGALALARNLWPEGKICLIDTENESASLYADEFDFDTIPLAPPFGTDRYLACIQAVIKGGYDVLIIDSITPQWDGEGGILRRKEEMDRRPGSNGYANWASFTPEHEAFKQSLQQSPIHTICTMRSKQDYILVANDKGKQVPKKVGMAPIQRDQMDYEFTLVFDIGMDHRGEVSKDRTGLFNEQLVDLANPKISEIIREWLDKGKEDTSTPADNQAQTIQEVKQKEQPSTDKRAYWGKILGDCVNYADFEMYVLSLFRNDKQGVAVAKEFLQHADKQIIEAMYKLLPDVDAFNTVIIPLSKIAFEVRKPFVHESAAEAKRRGYVVERTTGLYQEQVKK